MKKKFLLFLFISMLIISLTGCGSKEEEVNLTEKFEMKSHAVKLIIRYSKDDNLVVTNYVPFSVDATFNELINLKFHLSETDANNIEHIADINCVSDFEKIKVGKYNAYRCFNSDKIAVIVYKIYEADNKVTYLSLNMESANGTEIKKLISDKNFQRFLKSIEYEIIG